jgi:hypothetical protein
MIGAILLSQQERLQLLQLTTNGLETEAEAGGVLSACLDQLLEPLRGVWERCNKTLLGVITQRA